MPSPTLPERLTEQFYAWELRGRGLQEFAYPVTLEPPNVPFPGHFLPPIRDDGHRPSFLGRLIAPPRPEPALPEIEEPEVESFATDEPLVEIVVSLPRDESVKAESAERFLLALSGAELPLAFEVVGLPDELRVQLVSRAPDAGLLANQLRAFFPEVSISGEPQGLRETWTAAVATERAAERREAISSRSRAHHAVWPAGEKRPEPAPERPAMPGSEPKPPGGRGYCPNRQLPRRREPHDPAPAGRRWRSPCPRAAGWTWPCAGKDTAWPARSRLRPLPSTRPGT